MWPGKKKQGLNYRRNYDGNVAGMHERKDETSEQETP